MLCAMVWCLLTYAAGSPRPADYRLFPRESNHATSPAALYPTWTDAPTVMCLSLGLHRFAIALVRGGELHRCRVARVPVVEQLSRPGQSATIQPGTPQHPLAHQCGGEPGDPVWPGGSSHLTACRLGTGGGAHHCPDTPRRTDGRRWSDVHVPVWEYRVYQCVPAAPGGD